MKFRIVQTIDRTPGRRMTMPWLLLLTFCYNCYLATAYSPDLAIMVASHCNSLLGFDMHRALVDVYASPDILYGADDNLLFSPVSVGLTAGLLYLAAWDETAVQLERFLNWDEYGSPAELHFAYKEALENSGRMTEPLSLTTRMLVSDELPVPDVYQAAADVVYGTEVDILDFRGQSFRAAEEVRDWLSSMPFADWTLPIGSITAGTRLAVIGVGSASARLGGPFRRAIVQDESFYPGRFRVRRASMATSTGSFRIARDDFLHSRFLIIPLENTTAELVIALPDREKDLPTLERNLHPTLLWTLLDDAPTDVVEAKVPLLRLRSAYNMKRPLVSLGVRDVFNETTADLFWRQRIRDNFGVSSLLHLAAMDIERPYSRSLAPIWRNGTTLPRQKFHANRPFLFLLVNRLAKFILFMGRVKIP